jgi:hypothetical protein
MPVVRISSIAVKLPEEFEES